jgi:hypothetical protein
MSIAWWHRFSAPTGAEGLPRGPVPVAPPRRGAPSVRLPGGSVRIRRSALNQWLRGLQDKESAA